MGIRRVRKIAICLVLSSLACAASPQESPGETKMPTLPRYSLDALNMEGGDTAMPPISDSLVDPNSAYRRALLDHGMALRIVSAQTYAQDMLHAPVSADRQTYVGEAPFGNAMVQAIFTADLQQWHLGHAQFYASGVGNWVSWEPAGPKAFDLWSLYLYKEFGEDRFEVKAGYSSNDLEFVGMQVGGSTANNVQGVYAVLPYEVGMAYFPLTAPEVNAKLRGPARTYLKVGLQRSFDAAGGPATEARNHTGFRFDPRGDRLLEISELGYRRNPDGHAHQAWLRAGYMRNNTLYINQASGAKEPGNYCSYALADYQVLRPDPLQPAHGVYLGGSAMTVPSAFNAYNRYFEARLYQEAPFRRRPDDMASLVASYTGYSRYFTDPLVRAGKTVWRGQASLTGSYSAHLAQGIHMTLGVSYVHGPAISPRLPAALKFTASTLMFF